MKRFLALVAGTGMLAASAVVALSGTAATASPTASSASTLPTMTIALTGTKGVSVSGSTVSGAVTVVSSHTGKGQGDFGLVRLDQGVTFPQAFGAVNSHRGDPNALTPYGSLFADASAPGTIETVLTPGNYVALNLTGNGNPGFTTFTVTQSASPAALPPAQETETSIEFGFKGPKVLHDGTMVRTVNAGFLVHMDVLIGARNRATAQAIMTLLKAGKDRAAQKLASSFDEVMGPASPDAMQQQILNVRTGWAVQVCFMDTQDNREHTRLGMLRLVRVVG